ncbi:hypothetical protein [Nonomuraea sediminis]|uniref:hypothetical protein n=1 Tax=Nonomuraea sediminis TaxID=2835864 RepID=UPI001BDC19BA|nr:hypothetical protein [Nonomuraea sediminis]
MDPRRQGPKFVPINPVNSAVELQRELEQRGIVSDVQAGFGVALVLVCVGLIVWTDGDRFWWRSAGSTHRSRPIYAWHPATDAERAARRIERRYAELVATDPLSAATKGVVT